MVQDVNRTPTWRRPDLSQTLTCCVRETTDRNTGPHSVLYILNGQMMNISANWYPLLHHPCAALIKIDGNKMKWRGFYCRTSQRWMRRCVNYSRLNEEREEREGETVLLLTQQNNEITHSGKQSREEDHWGENWNDWRIMIIFLLNFMQFYNTFCWHNWLVFPVSFCDYFLTISQRFYVNINHFTA